MALMLAPLLPVLLLMLLIGSDFMDRHLSSHRRVISVKPPIKLAQVSHRRIQK